MNYNNERYNSHLRYNSHINIFSTDNANTRKWPGYMISQALGVTMRAQLSAVQLYPTSAVRHSFYTDLWFVFIEIHIFKDRYLKFSTFVRGKNYATQVHLTFSISCSWASQSTMEHAVIGKTRFLLRAVSEHNSLLTWSI